MPFRVDRRDLDAEEHATRLVAVHDREPDDAEREATEASER